MVVSFSNSFLNISLLFSPLDGVCQMSAGRTGHAKAMVNNSRLSNIEKNMNKTTIYRMMNIQNGKYF